MQILNLQDGIVKSPLVQQMQERPGEVARMQDASQLAFNEEITRQADETVAQLNQAEHEAIRADQERGQGQGRRRRRRPERQDAEAEPQNQSPPPAIGGPHRIDITV